MADDLYAIIHIDNLDKFFEENDEFLHEKGMVSVLNEKNTKTVIDEMEASGSITEFCFFKLASVDPRKIGGA